MLTDLAIRALQPSARAYRVTDAGGLYLLVTKAGTRCWRYDYRFSRKRKTLSIGTYPKVSLKLARSKCEKAKNLLAVGIDPGIAKRTRISDTESFESVAREWHGRNIHTWTPGHAERTLIRLEQNMFPWVGHHHINDVDAPLLLQVLRRIEARGAHETAHRVLSICGRVFRYGVATGRCQRDPSGDLRGALSPATPRHFSSITDPREIGRLLRDVDQYQGTFVVRQALRLGLYVFVRPGELRRAEWSEFNTQDKEWRLPAGKMKMGRQHIVPLSNQALSIIDELRPLTGDGRYLFPSLRSDARPMSENTINAALRRLGYSKDEVTGHGFRTTASTILNEQGWTADAIERQLAHSESNKVRAAYNHAEHLPERRKMMQAWADYLDGLKAGADVVGFRVK